MNQALIAFERVGLSQNYINWIDYNITLNFNKIKTIYYIIFKQLKPPPLNDGLLETVQDFLIKLGIKPLMHLILEISIFH